jgi:Carboxypeptidase regulatory-like domain
MAGRIRDVILALLLLVLLGARLSAQNTWNTAQLSIIVTDKTNAYVAGAQIKICPHAGVLPQKPQTYQSGTLRLNLVPGSYDLFVASPVYKPWYRQVDLRAGSNETITAVLEAAGRTLVHTGHGWDPPSPPAEPLRIDVTDEAGVPIAYASFDGFPDANTMADEKGQLRLKLVPTTYLVAVTSPGYERWEKIVEVIPRQENLVKVVLKRTPMS